jgi:hypothetical protein
MKEIKFRPLRLNKKTGKIVVASYLTWRRVKVYDHSKFELSIDDQYESMDENSFVYDHFGKQLFWFGHTSPSDLKPIFPDVKSAIENFNVDPSIFEGEQWKMSNIFGYSTTGFDVDGVPVFSHFTANYCATHYEDMGQFTPLTVGMVRYWFGWFLYQLQNSYLEIQGRR